MAEHLKESLLDEDAARDALRTLTRVFSQSKAVSTGFNLIQEAYDNLNENAHTRILAALLRLKPVRNFFFRFLDRKYPERRLNAIAEADDRNAEVRCFEGYIDACVSVGDYRIIVENKVKGAVDQPEQIDRYTATILGQGVRAENIFVLYITATGGFPSDSSFKGAKEILGYQDASHPGRFFALSYLTDILPWLYEMLGRRIDLELGELGRELFRSGIIQYANYIEGPALLDSRQEQDGFENFRDVVREMMHTERPLPFIMEFCTWTDFLILRQRQYLCHGLDKTRKALARVAPEERQRIFKMLFYRAFHMAVPDNVFYMPIQPNIGKSPEMCASVGLWEETSTLQVDVWCTNENSRTYDNAFAILQANLEHMSQVKAIAREMDYNHHKMVRFIINTFGELQCVIELLGGEMLEDKETAAWKDTMVLSCDGEALLRQLQSSASRWCIRHHIPPNDDRWDLWNAIEIDDGRGNVLWVDHHYGYVHDWAIQLYESTNEPMRAIDVFGKRQKGPEDVFALGEYMANQSKCFPFRTLPWDGRVFYRFPIPTMEYAKKLLRILWTWRDDVR